MLKSEKIVEALSCPICGLPMTVENKGCGVLYCNGEKRHLYDFSASGYVNLAPPSQSNGGDAKNAVKARTAFLNTGYYAPIAQKLCELLHKYCSDAGVVVDAGCGEGYYSEEILKNKFTVFGFDLSKHAVEYAAKRAKRTDAENSFFAVASVFALPLKDNSADAVVNVFAPCVEDEYSRVLKDNGILIAVHAGKEHLLGLKRAIYETAHFNDERADLPQNMEILEGEALKYTITVHGNDNIKNLFAMTPYYWRTSKDDIEKLNFMDEIETEIDIMFSVYRKTGLESI